MIEKLGQSGHFTLFAPTNDAFENLDREVMDRLMKDKVSLQGKPQDIKPHDFPLHYSQTECFKLSKGHVKSHIDGRLGTKKGFILI